MSDMSTTASFTLRDLNRQPAKILAAVRKFGSAEIRTRAGEVFTMASKSTRSRRVKGFDVRGHFEAVWEKQRAAGYVPVRRADFDEERFNRILAGEA